MKEARGASPHISPVLLRRPKSFRGCVMFRSTILGRKYTPAVVNLTCLATKELKTPRAYLLASIMGVKVTGIATV
jgi:hypothetical protein